MHKRMPCRCSNSSWPQPLPDFHRLPHHTWATAPHMCVYKLHCTRGDVEQWSSHLSCHRNIKDGLGFIAGAGCAATGSVLALQLLCHQPCKDDTAAATAAAAMYETEEWIKHKGKGHMKGHRAGTRHFLHRLVRCWHLQLLIESTMWNPQRVLVIFLPL